MEIIRIKILGSVNIGLYAKATNKYLIYYSDIVKRKVNKLINKLGVYGLPIKPVNTRVISPFVAANSYGMVISKYVDLDIKENIKRMADEFNLNIVELDVKYTAIGNLIAMNDKTAIVSPLISHKARREIADILDIEIISTTIGRASYIGSLLMINNKGALAAPIIRDDELDVIKSFLNVDVYMGTVNNGIQFISSGLIANDKVVFVGENTVGRELFVISQAFGGG